MLRHHAEPVEIDVAAGLFPDAETIDDERLLMLVEALLFVAGEPAPVDRLATALKTPVARVEAALQALAD